jgi:hypothetical protein
MLELLSRSARLDLGVASLLVGVGLVLAGLWSMPRPGGPRRSWPAWALTYLYVFRRVVVGACVVGAGIGLVEDIAWLRAASLCIGLGELLESSYYINVLRWGRAHGIIEATPGFRATRAPASCARPR